MAEGAGPSGSLRGSSSSSAALSSSALIVALAQAAQQVRKHLVPSKVETGFGCKHPMP